VPLDLKKLTKRLAEKHTAANIWKAFKLWRDDCNEYKGITRNDFEEEIAAIHGVEVKNVKANQHCGDIVGRFYPVMFNEDGLKCSGDIYL
jgi:hypothetical protein